MPLVDRTLIPQLDSLLVSDFLTMEHKLDTNRYITLDDFVADARLVFSNCKLFNGQDTIYYKAAVAVEKCLDTRLLKLAKLTSRNTSGGKRKWGS